MYNSNLGGGVERLFRYIGLIELSKLQLVEILYFYLPEIIMVFTSTIIQRMLIKINVKEEETSNTFMEIADPDSRTVTWQQTSSISVAISMGKTLVIFYDFNYIFYILIIIL